MSNQNSPETSVDPMLLEILVCPACKTPVALIAGDLQCRNPRCRRRYGIKGGIPVMLIEESSEISPQEFEALEFPEPE